VGLAAAVLALWPAGATAAPGNLDPLFGSGGVARIRFAEGRSEGLFVQPASDGDAVVGGEVSGPDSDRYVYWALVRLDRFGIPDPSFGQNGRVVHRFHPGAHETSQLHGLGVQPDGRIVAGGSSLLDEDPSLIARFTEAGALDTSFGQNGLAAPPPVRQWELVKMAVASDGSIYAFGYGCAPASPAQFCSDSVLVRWTKDGAVDTGFGSGGAIETTPAVIAVDLATQGTKALVAGVGQDKRGRVARYEANGAPDGGFGGGGLAELPAGYTGSEVAAGPKGEVAVGVRNISDNLSGLVRLLGNGSPDPGFGSGGLAARSPDEQIDDIAVMPSGRIVDALQQGDGTMPERWTTGGQLDAEWSPPQVKYWRGARGLATLPDERLLVTGGVDLGGAEDVAVLRLRESGPGADVRPVAKTQKFGAVAKKGLAVDFGCVAACSAVAQLEAAPSLLTAARKKPVVVASAKRNLGRGAAGLLTLKLTALAKKKLAKRKSSKLTLRVTITAPGEPQAVVRTQSLTLKR
jgi:uncharacterized delta-60 repeat protein